MDGSIHCNPYDTCCRSKVNPSGYECLSMPEAVCCSIGLGACPKGYTCDNKNGKCLTKNLEFLSEIEESKNENLNILEDSKNPIVKYIDPYSTAYELISSFIEGIGLFDHITDNNKCFTNSEFFNEFINFLSSLKNLKADETLPKELEKIAQRVIDNKQIYLDEFAEFGILKKNVNGVYERINEIIHDPEYFNKFSTHSILYLGQIRDLFEELKPLYEEHKWEELGFATGKFLRFVFLWNFDQK